MGNRVNTVSYETVAQKQNTNVSMRRRIRKCMREVLHKIGATPPGLFILIPVVFPKTPLRSG